MSTQEQYPTEIQGLFNGQKKLYYPDGVEPVPKMLCSTTFFPRDSGLWHTPPKEMLPSTLQASYSFFVNSNFVNSKRPTMPKKKIMVLWNDFGPKDGYKGVRNNPYGNLHSSATWRNLLELLHHAGIKPKNCFFTNAYMGLRVAGGPTGPSPGADDPKFVKRCESFFLDKQVAMQKPRLILALGEYPIKFIAQLSSDLAAWRRWQGFEKLDASGPLISDVRFKGSEEQTVTVVALVHPSMRNSNAKHRCYCGKEGKAAELAMLKDALKQSGLHDCSQ